MLISGLMFLGAHLSHTTQTVLDDISKPGFTADDKWKNMYRVDLYARDRVMKSARLLLPYLSQDDKKPDTILDVGCFTWEARKYFPRATGYVGIDGEKYHKDTRVVDLDHGFEPIPANHALCLETLEHLAHPEMTLKSIYNSLPDHGKLVVSVPNEATVFHRIRCLFGTVDSDCFASEGKHLHLPSLRQSRKFVSSQFHVLSEKYYISPSACGSKQAWIGGILKLFPDSFHYWLSERWPSLFARGFIFLLEKRPQAGTSPEGGLKV